MSLFIGIIFFGLIVLIHELGHFIAAKKSGITVQKFSVGFGKSLLKYSRNGTEYRLGLIPLGGYVKLQGDDITLKEFVPGDFYYASWKKRTVLVMAGPLMNLFLAYFLFTGYYYSAGMTTVDERAVVGGVVPRNPADIAGLKAGDIVLGINGMQVKNWYEMAGLISGYPGRKIRMKLSRAGQVIEKSMTPMAYGPSGSGKIGIRPQMKKVSFGFFESAFYGARTEYIIVTGMLSEFRRMFAGKQKMDLMGPIGIVHLSYETMKTGFAEFVFLVGAMSISVGIINLFPLPVLDGGHVLLNLIEALRRKRASEKTMRNLNMAGIAVLLLIFISASVSDINRFFTGW